MADRNWINDVFKEAIESGEPYAQTESKVKPAEKMSWWEESPALPLKVRDIIQYVPDDETLKFIKGDKWLCTRGIAVRLDMELGGLKVVKITARRSYLEVEVEE